MTNFLDIPADPKRKAYLEAGIWNTGVCMDHLFARNVRRMPEKIILCDTPNKQELTGTAPLRLTAVDCERIVNNLCARFQELGLEEGAVIALQMPNIAELQLTLIACMRSGLVPALLPLLWSDKDIHAALDLLHPKAIISVTNAGPLKPADKLRYAAASLFSIRYLMAFGNDAPDGVISLQDVIEATLTAKNKTSSFSGRADHAALITFRFTALGPSPVVRSHNHAMSAALMPMLEAGMEPDDEIIFSSIQPSSISGLATGFLPWLLSGGRIVLHHASTSDDLVHQIVAENATRASLPAPLLNEVLSQLEEQNSKLKSIFAVYPNAAMPSAITTVESTCTIIDCRTFDEFAFIARIRDGLEPRGIQLGQQIAPSNGVGPALAEFAISGTTSRLLIRGPSTPWNGDIKEGYQQTGHIVAAEGTRLKFAGRSDQVAYIGGLAVPINEVGSAILNMEGVVAVQMNTLSDPVFGEILEARIYFARSPEAQETRIARLKAEFDHQLAAPYKIPARFVVDPMIVGQKTTLQRAQKKAV
ncbi:MAG: class I adenylate-forming enzyme family protein [Pseudomonadota bacterium]